MMSRVLCELVTHAGADLGNVLVDTFVFVIQSLSHVRLFATPRTAACRSPLSSAISQCLLKLMSIKSVVSRLLLLLSCFSRV